MSQFAHFIARHTVARKSAPSSSVRQINILRLLNFLNFAALGLSAPFLNIYLREIGLSGTQIGLLVSLGALLELSLIPLANALADRQGRHRWVYRWQVGMIGVMHLILALFRAPLLVGGAFVLNAINARAVNEMLAQLTITKLDQLKRDIFGKVRLWGSLGWAVATVFSGALIALGSYPLAFFTTTVLRLGSLPLTETLPKSTDRGDDNDPANTAPRSSAVYVLMLSQFLFFTGLNAYSNFLWIHMREGLGIAPEHIGIFAAIFAMAELLPMMFIDRFITNWGIRRVLLFGMISMSLEWLFFGFVPSVPWLIALQMARGMGFTAFTIGITVIIARVSKPVNVATNRALITVTMPALSMLLTSPIAGWIYDTFGPTATFVFSALLGLLATVFLLLNYRRLGHTEKIKLAD